MCGCLTYKCIWLWNHAYEKIFVSTEFTCKMYCTNKRLSSPLHMCRKKKYMCCIYLKWSIEPLLHIQSVWLVLFFVTHVRCLQPQNLVHPSSLSLQNVYTCTIMQSTVHMQAKKIFQYKIIKYSKRLKYLYIYEFHLSLLAMYMYKENEPKKE